MQFEIVQNLISAKRNCPNRVLTAQKRYCPPAWVFDCEFTAAFTAKKLNKSHYTHGIYAVACIIN